MLVPLHRCAFLGFIILDASSFFRTTYVFAGIILIGLIGQVSDRSIALLARTIVHWEGRRQTPFGRPQHAGRDRSAPFLDANQ